MKLITNVSISNTKGVEFDTFKSSQHYTNGVFEAIEINSHSHQTKGKRFLLGFTCDQCKQYERFPKPFLVKTTFKADFTCYDCALNKKSST